MLEIVFMKNLSQSMELETLTALTSDHNPVLITIGDEIQCQQHGARHNYKKAYWYLYKRSLDETLTFYPIRCIKDIDQAVDCFTDAVHTAIKGSIPQQTPQRCSIYDLPSSIKHSIAEKNRARRQWQKYRTPDLLKKYNMLTKLLKTQISQHRGEKLGSSNSSSEGFRQFSLENDTALNWKKGTEPTNTRKDSSGMQQQRQGRGPG
ncbi:hypothetical protein NDU88_001622 [Pleurodeles waltl]|uniref:Uncharacterized protein n=1 Tax=Pleurodeles waltl TaxID=8319 RepID=A0AAV7SCQ6_PLEWA|nr:hypothetical protein NDU88_001622 [Pleurodeles waltl]